MTSPQNTPADSPLLGVLRQLEADGYRGQFKAVEDRRIQCLTCHEHVAAADIEADDVTRLEGASDPADMLMVVPLRCPHCGTLGSLVVNYGPETTPEDAGVLLALERDEPHEGDDAETTPGMG